MGLGKVSDRQLLLGENRSKDCLVESFKSIDIEEEKMFLTVEVIFKLTFHEIKVPHPIESPNRVVYLSMCLFKGSTLSLKCALITNIINICVGACRGGLS